MEEYSFPYGQGFEVNNLIVSFFCRCSGCHANCSTCFGGDRDQCLTCVDGMHFFNNSCAEKCPLGMFADKTGRCQLCSLVCDKGCAGVASNCTACKGEGLPLF